MSSGTKVQRRKPDRTHGAASARAASVIRQHMIARMEQLAVEGGRLDRMAAALGVGPDKANEILYWSLHLYFPEEMDPDPEVERVIGPVPVGVLPDNPRRVSPRQLELARERFAAAVLGPPG